jgi:hypothetical protein
MLLIRASLVMLALLVASAASAQQGCVVILPDGTKKQCVTAATVGAGIADKILAETPQTADNLEDSYNCFYYVQTNVLGHTPNGIEFHPAIDPRSGWAELNHQVPGTDYFDETFLRSQGYHFVALKSDLQAAIYEPGDIVLVPGQDADLKMNEQFKHVAIVYATNGRGVITRLRQKYDPFHGVVDLTTAEFESVYEPEAVGNLPAQYRIYRHPPFVGQTKVPTGTYRGGDGYLYATYQLIKIIVFSFTPDGEHLGPNPLNSANGGLYVAAEGIFHRGVNGNNFFQFLALYDGNGRARQFNQTIPVYTCNETAC